MRTLELVKLTSRVYKLTLLFPKKEPLRFKTREVAAELLEQLVNLLSTQEPAQRELLLSEVSRLHQGLDSLLELARRQNWVQQNKILKLQRLYNRIIASLDNNAVAFERSYPSAAPLAQTIQQPIVPQFAPQPTIQPAPQTPINSMAPVVPSGVQPVSAELPATRIYRAENGRLNQLEERQLRVLRMVQQRRELQIGELSRQMPEVSRRTLLRDLERLLELKLVQKHGNGRGVFYRIMDDAAKAVDQLSATGFNPQ